MSRRHRIAARLAVPAGRQPPFLGVYHNADPKQALDQAADEYAAAYR